MAEPLSAIEVASLPPPAFDCWLKANTRRRAAVQDADWTWWASAGQLAPPGDWRTWLLMAGRGFGKTRAGAEWVRAICEADGSARIAVVGASRAEARAVMVEGPAGLLAVAGARRPLWERSLGRLTWHTGAVVSVHSAADPDTLRGAQHSHAWADEIAKWPFGEAAWDNLQLGLRLGSRPQLVATTTPRPVALVRRLLAEDGVTVTRGCTADNRAHLAPGFVAAVTRLYGGTRLGRQELDGELIDDVAGALWPRALLERCRVVSAPTLVRVVIGVDPPGGRDGDACGIVAAGLAADGRGIVLADASVAGCSPEGWARVVAETAARHRADRVIAEKNMGGEMVASVLRAANQSLPVKLVHASRNKAARAEPVAALYEAGRVAHVGAWPELEDEMAGLAAGGRYEGPGRSPDRADALVWALTALMGDKPPGEPGVRRL